LIQFTAYSFVAPEKITGTVIARFTREAANARGRMIAVLLNKNRNRPETIGIRSIIRSIMYLYCQDENEKQQDSGYHGKEIKTHIATLKLSYQISKF
jgi:hypothetical protein